jgi:uncharacterized membrane protein YphA (DoxX/SURF4 family)
MGAIRSRRREHFAAVWKSVRIAQGMDFALLGVRLLLAATFAVAALTKAFDAGGFRRTLADFGVAASTAGMLAAAVPAVELATAALLVPATAAIWGAAAGLLLLAVFTAAVVAALAKGRAPDCRCFGQISSAPIGLSTLVRNLVLGTAMVFLLLRGPGAELATALDRWNTASPGEQLIVLGLAAAAALAVERAQQAGRLRARNQRLEQRIETLERQLAEAAVSGSPSGSGGGLPLGTPAPAFDLPLLAGDRASLDALIGPGIPLLLIFASSHCAACGALWRDIGRWQRDHASRLATAVVGSGSAQALEMKLMGFDVENVLLEGDSKLSDAYRLPGVPSAVFIGPDKTIASETVLGPAAIRALVKQRA